LITWGPPQAIPARTTKLRCCPPGRKVAPVLPRMSPGFNLMHQTAKISPLKQIQVCRFNLVAPTQFHRQTAIRLSNTQPAVHGL
jgi:hypothetical protein